MCKTFITSTCNHYKVINETFYTLFFSYQVLKIQGIFQWKHILIWTSCTSSTQRSHVICVTVLNSTDLSSHKGYLPISSDPPPETHYTFNSSKDQKILPCVALKSAYFQFLGSTVSILLWILLKFQHWFPVGMVLSWCNPSYF